MTATLSDPQDSVVKDVKSTVLPEAALLKRGVTSNHSGRFVVAGAAARQLYADRQHEGFVPVKLSNIVSKVSDERALRIQMKPGNLSNAVTNNSAYVKICM